MLPAGVTVSSVLNDLVSQCRDAGIDVDSESLERAGTRLAHMDSDEPDLTPGQRDTSRDVVRVYLAEMSRVPLLSREKEVALAKQIERGRRTVMVAISHTPSLVQQVMRLADALREDERLIRRLVTHRHGDVTATRLKRRARQVRGQIEAVEAGWADAQTRHAAWQRVPTRHRHIAQRAQWKARRAHVRVAQLMRRIAFSHATQCDLVEGVRASAAKVSSARREVDVIEQRLKRFSNRPCTTWGGRGTSARTDAGGPMRAYSMDLRERALLDSNAGMKAADVAAKYRVSGSWVRLLKQRRRDTGEVAPRVQRQGRRGMREPHLHTVAALLAAHPDRTLAELKDALATPASVPTVWRAVRALGLTVQNNGPPVRTRSA